MATTIMECNSGEAMMGTSIGQDNSDVATAGAAQ